MCTETNHYWYVGKTGEIVSLELLGLFPQKHMRHKHTFTGPRNRVQLVIFDFTDEDTPAHLRKERPTFAIYSLPQSRPKKTAFTTGTCHYYGDNPDLAWDTIHIMIPDLLKQCPRTLREYLLRWKQA